MHNYQTLSVKRLAFIVLETFQRYGASVVNSGDESLSFNLELHQVISIGAQVAVLVKYLHGYKTQVRAVAFNGAAVRSEAYLCRLACGMNLPAVPRP